MTRRLGVIATLLGFALSAAPPATAAGAPCPGNRNVCVGSGDGGFGAEAGGEQRGPSGPAGNSGASRQVVDNGLRSIYVPACPANRPGDNDALCTAAVTLCPVEGDIRSWLFTRRVTAADPDPPWQRSDDPPFVCRGPAEEAAVVDPRVLVAAMIEREFQRVVVLRGEAQVSPRPQTLVNIPTRFETPTTERYDIPLTLAGQSVVITAQAERWTWRVGDGTAPSTSAKGTRGRIEHTYRQASEFAPAVSIEWSGTYTVNGEAALPIQGTVSTDGVPVELQVREARSELVAG